MGLAYAAKARRITIILQRYAEPAESERRVQDRLQCGGTCSCFISVMGTMSVSSISF